MDSEVQTGKSLVNKDGEVTKLVEWATGDANSIEDMIALFEEEGVAVSSGEELTGDYSVVTKDEKQLWAARVQGRRMFIVKFAFYDGQNGEFAAVHCIIDGMGKFIFNDGSKAGVYGQLSELYSKRIATGVPDSRAKAGLLVQRGLHRNKTFFYDSRTGKAIKKGEEIPDEFKKEAHPTWSLQF